MRGSGRGRAPGASVRVSAFNRPALLPTEGSSLRGLGRGRSVRLQDPSGEPCVLWKGRAGAKGEDASGAPGGVGCGGLGVGAGGEEQRREPPLSPPRMVRAQATLVAGAEESWGGAL